DRACVRLQKAGDQPEGGGLAAAGRTQQGHEFLVVDVQVQPVQDALAVKIHHNIPQGYDHRIVHFPKESSPYPIASSRRQACSRYTRTILNNPAENVNSETNLFRRGRPPCPPRKRFVSELTFSAGLFKIVLV